MKSVTGRIIFACVVCSAINAPLLADTPDLPHTRWQMKQLFQASTAQLQREQNNHVFIYHNLPDKVVELAMDKQFDRLESMMFTGIIITDKQGSPLSDPETGEIITEDDGCD